MKIKSIDEEKILFDNGNTITFDHEQDCCEWNYADFKQLDESAMSHDFSESLLFEYADGCGFRFGDGKVMFFVPCYSEQNGYYSDQISIYYNGKEQLSFDCEEITD